MMPKYRVTGPDGQTYDVTAPEGTSEQEVMDYVRSQAGGDGARGDDDGLFKTADDVVRQLAQGITFGFADEIAAGLNTLLGGGDFSENVAGERARDVAFQEQNPALSTGLQITGGVGGAVAGGGVAGATRAGQAAISAVSKLPRVVQGLLVGGTAGGVGGVGFSEGDIEERLKAGGYGAALGGSLGMALPIVIALVGQFGKATVRPILDRLGKGPKQAGLRKTLQMLQRDKITPDEATRRLREMGGEAIPADLGPNIRGLSEMAAQRPGASLERAQDVLTARRGGQVNRILSRFDDAIGPTGRKVIEKVEESPAFRRTLEQMIDVDDDLVRYMDRPSLKAAWSKARTIAAEENKSLPTFEEFKRRIADREIVQVKTQVLHWLKKGLDDVLEPGRDPVTGKVISKTGRNMTEAQKKTRFDFRSLVKERNPEYAASLDRIATGKRLEDALKTGRDFFKLKSPEDVSRIVGRYNEEERRAFQRGIRDAIENRIAGPGELSFDQTRAVLGQAPKLRAAFGDNADKLIRGLKTEREFAKTEGQVLQNSATFRRQAFEREAGLDPSIAASAARGDVGGVATGAMRAGVQALRGPSQRVSDELGPTLFPTTAAERDAALGLLTKNAGTMVFRQNLLRQIEDALVLGAGQQSGRATGRTTRRR